MPRSKKKNGVKLSKNLMAIVAFLIVAVGLMAVVVLARSSQDTRNQAWGGRGGSHTNSFNRGSFDRRDLKGSARDVNRADKKAVAGIDLQSLVIGKCDPETFVNNCTADLFRYCTPQGVLLQMQCSDYDASCGTVPQGRHQGESACIPNDLPTNPSDSLSDLDKLVVGTCQPADKGSKCVGNTMQYCSAAGKLLELDCTTQGATCGTLPNGMEGCVLVK